MPSSDGNFDHEPEAQAGAGKGGVEVENSGNDAAEVVSKPLGGPVGTVIGSTGLHDLQIVQLYTVQAPLIRPLNCRLLPAFPFRPRTPPPEHPTRLIGGVKCTLQVASVIRSI